MFPTLPTRLRTASSPALLVTLVLLIVWLYARFLYTSAAAWPAVAPHVLLAWIALMFLLTTTAAILWAAAAPQKSPGPPVSLSPGPSVFLAYALLVDAAGILLLLIALSSALLTFFDVFRIYLILVTWVALFTLLAFFLRRYSATLSVAASLTCMAFLFTAPISAAPLAHAASRWGTGGGAAHENFLDAIAYATPFLPALDAVKSSIHDAAAWPEWPLMYRFSDLGQEIALRAHWPLAAAIYASLALLLLGLMVLQKYFVPPRNKRETPDVSQH